MTPFDVVAKLLGMKEVNKSNLAGGNTTISMCDKCGGKTTQWMCFDAENGSHQHWCKDCVDDTFGEDT